MSKAKIGNFTGGKPIRWYVVASRVDSAIYSDGDEDHHFHLVSRIKNEDGRLTEGELDSDKPGRGFSSAGGQVRHALDRRSKQHEEVVLKFSHQIAEALERARGENRFEELVLVAEPHFLGLLRDSLSLEMKKMIKGEVGKEYNQHVQVSEIELRAHILDALKH